jgi:hypothetical protein
MNKRKRRHQAWAVQWEQVYQSDREQRLQRVFALILPQAEVKTRRLTGEKTDAQASRPLRQSVQ